MISSDKSTTTPKKGGLNDDPERVFERIILTAERAVKNILSLTCIAKLDHPAIREGLRVN